MTKSTGGAMKRNHQGRIYFAAEIRTERGLVPAYRAVIWSGDDGRSLWETGSPARRVGLDEDPEKAFARMKEHALTMDRPVDLWRHGHKQAGTVSAAA